MLYALKQKIVVLFLVAVVIISAGVILSREGRVLAHPMDQSFVSTADLRIGQYNGVWYFHYPYLHYAGGITASLTAGLYKLIVPTTPEHLNHHIKIFAMLLFFITGYLLARQYIKTRPGLFLFISLMATSGFQFIEPTSELFAAAYLFVFLYGVSRQWNVLISTFFLVCFALCKAEFTLTAGLVMVYWVWVIPSRKLKVLSMTGFIFWLILFIAPGLYLYGRENFLGAEEHALVTFRPHYSALMAKYNLLNYPTWLKRLTLMAGEFPNAKTFSDAVIGYPQKYLTFILLSILTSAFILIGAFKGIFGILILRLMRFKEKIMPNHFEAMVLIGFIASLIPATLIAFLHVRYLEKFLILYALIGVAFWEYYRKRSDKPPDIFQARTILWLLLLTIVLQVICLNYMIKSAHFL